MFLTVPNPGGEHDAIQQVPGPFRTHRGIQHGGLPERSDGAQCGAGRRHHGGVLGQRHNGDQRLSLGDVAHRHVLPVRRLARE